MSTFYAELALQVGPLYGLFVAVVGVIGYVQAGSVISMVAGICSGAVAAGAAFYARKNLVRGLQILLGTAVFLTVVFHKRYNATQQFMPGAFMALNSSVIVIVCALAIQSHKVQSGEINPKKTPKKSNKKE